MSDTPDTTPVDEYTRLISLAVHELRTPLSVVSGYLRMLRDGLGDGDRQRRMITEAEKSCRRLGALVEELSDLGKLDAGTATIAEETFDVFTLIRDVAASLPRETGEEPRLEIEVPTSAGRLTGDKTRLRAALACAMRAVMREHGPSSTIVVDARRTTEDGHPVALILVAPAGELEQVKQAQRSPLNETRGGLGLGLPIARRVVGRFGGEIWSVVVPDSDGRAGARGALGLALPVSD